MTVACRRHSPADRTRWLVINSPNNPTGVVYSAEELSAFGAVLARYPKCLVMSDDEWWRGTLIWESARRADGLWWATVTYEKNGRTLIEVRSQHDIRAR